MTPKPKKGMFKRGGWEVTKKLLKAIPFIGPIFTVGFAGHVTKSPPQWPGTRVGVPGFVGCDVIALMS